MIASYKFNKTLHRARRQTTDDYMYMADIPGKYSTRYSKNYEITNFQRDDDDDINLLK